MVDNLVVKKLIDPNKGAKALKIFERYWEDKIAIIWSAEDVIAEAKQNGKRCSKEKAQEILQSLYDDHDCNYGITWQTIDEYLS
jgi:hypothetical protein